MKEIIHTHVRFTLKFMVQSFKTTREATEREFFLFLSEFYRLRDHNFEVDYFKVLWF